MDSQPRLFCNHWWVFESPHGKTCKAICKYCGAEKEESTSFVVKGRRICEPNDNFKPTKMTYGDSYCTTGGLWCQVSYHSPLRQDEDFAYNDSYLT